MESSGEMRRRRPIVRGSRVAARRSGVIRYGRVWYVDGLQILVKWDDGRSSSLRVGRDDRDLDAVPDT